MHIACIYFRTFCYVVHDIKGKFFDKRYGAIPMGISYIVSSLKMAGYEAEVLYYNVQRDRVYNKIKQTDKLVLLSIITEADYETAKEVIGNIKKKYPKIKIGVGGQYPTLVPEDMMANKDIDMVCIGEGEIADVEYAKQAEKGQYHKTDNLWIRDDNGEIIKCDRSVVIEDIDSLPYPERDAWLDGFSEKPTRQSVLLERGCNNKCIYCSHDALSEKQEGKYLRYRNIDKVMEEIEYLCIRYPYTEAIRFVVDNALSDPKYFMELCQKLIKFNEKRKKKLQFCYDLAISKETLKYKEEIIGLMKKTNVSFFNIGLQSVSLDIRKKLCRPYYTNEEFEEFIYTIKSAGINFSIDLLWHPSLYTKQIHKETITYLRKIQPLYIIFYWLVPFKGTKLYKYKDKIVSYNKAKLMDKLRYNILEYVLYYKIYGIKKVFKFLCEEIRKEIYGIKKFLKSKRKNNIIMMTKERIKTEKEKKYISKAKIYMDNKKYKKAIKYFNKVKIKEDNYWIYGDRAIAKMNMEDYEGAIKDFDKILKLEPKEIYKEKREECLEKLNKKVV